VKYSNLKIPFPGLPYLKFDFTGIPIVLASLLFGFIPGTITSIVASIAILARSGDVIGASMKGLAEFSTMLGVIAGLRLLKRFRYAGSYALGLAFRVLIMTAANWILITAGAMRLGAPDASFPLFWTSLVGVFNVIQGSITILGGYSIFEALRRRVPSLVKKTGGDSLLDS
jgi:riboflavin transporter FmnP